MGLRCPCAARDRRVLLRPRRCVAAAELHGFRRLRSRTTRPAAPRRARQLRTPRGGTALPNGAGQHRLLRHRRRAALGGRLARCGAAPRGEGRAVEGSLPDRILPAGGDHARRGGGRLALPLSPAPRAPEPAPRRLRHRPHRLARRSSVGDALHHPAAYARPASPTRAGGDPVRRRAQVLAVHGALGVAALLTVLPLLWMVTASFMPAGEASAVPPRLVPSAATLDHYRALFARLHL